MPLTKTDQDGDPYERFADVEVQIAEVLATEPSTWSPETLKSETLVNLIRCLRARNDMTNLGRLMKCLAARVTQIAKDFTSGMNSSQAYEFIREIGQEVNVLIFMHPATRKSEYLEIAFREAVQQQAIRLITRLTKVRTREVSDSLLHATDPPEDGSTSFIDSRPDGSEPPDELVIEAEQKRRTPEWIRQGLNAISNPLHREAVVLHHLEGWPIKSKIPDIPDLSTRFGKSDRQIQNWINKALEQMRAALGDIA